MMPSNVQHTVKRYYHLYKKLYDREPRGVRVIDSEFVIVNDTQIRISDLEMLTQQLEKEYQATRQQQRSVIKRLINWFRQS